MKATDLAPEAGGPVGRFIGFCLGNQLLVGLFTVLLLVAGLGTAPFDWDIEGVPRAPVPVDAIPDIGENQQIVFTRWPGRSPSFLTRGVPE